MANIIQVRRDTAANWTSDDPTLAQGEAGLETDTGKIKYGDGSTVWTELGYLTDAASTFTDVFTGAIETVADIDYVIAVNLPYAGEITSVTTKCASGTCTLTTKINTTALGGTANSVSSSEDAQAHTTSNTFAVGDDIKLTASSNAVCLAMTVTIAYTRGLD